MNNNPKISVLMPAYNTEKYISEAIESILNQTFRDFEFIIIDDCSTDGTWEIIQEYAKIDNRIIALRNEKNLKICKTLNRGIEIAKGKYIARMDADDWSYPDRLEKQFKFMEENADIAISGGTMEVCDEKLKVLNQRKYNLTDEKIRKKLFRYSPFSHPLVIYKTELAEKINGYDEFFYVAQDYDFYFRIGRQGKFANLKDRLLKLRTHPKSSSLKQARIQEKFTLTIRKKAVREYGYKMSLVDKLYFVGQYLSMFIIPLKIKIWLFNLIRK
jgi:glycosyltransferase involved in cell wall biosynthesis